MIEFFGRLHLVLLHLPIGFLLLLGALEFFALVLGRNEAVAPRDLILALIAPIAIITAVCGWLLSWSGGYDAGLLMWHKWFGVSVAVASVVLYLVHRAGRVTLYKVVLVLALVLVSITGHLGGALTHGSDYLTEPLKKMFGKGDSSESHGPAPTANLAVAAPRAAGSAYSAVIQPIFNDYCIGCHGPKKSKGGLRLDSFQGLDKGGKSGAAMVPGSVALSLLCKRLALPAADEDHMPPDGKRQPTADDVALLRWWIDAGADADKTVAELNPSAEVLKAAQNRLGTAK